MAAEVNELMDAGGAELFRGVGVARDENGGLRALRGEGRHKFGCEGEVFGVRAAEDDEVRAGCGDF